MTAVAATALRVEIFMQRVRSEPSATSLHHKFASASPLLTPAAKVSKCAVQYPPGCPGTERAVSFSSRPQTSCPGS